MVADLTEVERAVRSQGQTIRVVDLRQGSRAAVAREAGSACTRKDRQGLSR
jgi:hypothetical protein